MSETKGEILVTREGPIVTVTLSNIEYRNAITTPMWGSLYAHFISFNRDDSLRAIILMGAGDVFSAGANISEFKVAASTPESARDFWLMVNRANKAIEDCMHQTIAVIKGYALGAGLDLAAACGIRLAAEGSRLGVPAANIGVGYSHASHARLNSLVGGHTEYLLTGVKLYTAEEAKAIGLINEVYPADKIDEEARRLAEKISSFAPLPLRENRRIAVARRRAQIPYGIDDELPKWGGSNDVLEGINAFQEKRQPNFTGT